MSATAKPGPTPARETQVEVKALESVVMGDRLIGRGQLFRTGASHAAALVRERRACWTIPIKALVPVFAGTTWMAPGDVQEVSEEVALRLESEGMVEIADRSRLSDPAMPPPRGMPRPSEPVRLGPFDGEPTVSVRLHGPVLFNGKVMGPGNRKGSPVTVTLPESRAAQAIATGAGELTLGSTLSPSGLMVLWAANHKKAAALTASGD